MSNDYIRNFYGSFIYIYRHLISFFFCHVRINFFQTQSLGDKSTAKTTAELAEEDLDSKLVSRLPEQLREEIRNTAVSIPNLRKGTLKEPKVIDFMEFGNSLALFMNPNLPITPFQWIHSLEDSQVFDSCRMLQSIQKDAVDGSDNWFNNLSMIIDLLGCHGDNHNCNERRQLNAFKSNDKDGWTVGGIFYTRRSVTNVLKRMKVLRTIIDDMNRLFEDPDHFLAGMRSINSRTHAEAVPELKFVLMPSILRLRANLNPTIFAQGVIPCVLLMIKKFRLNMIELCCVLQTIDYVSDSSCYFIAACVYTLKYVDLPQRRRTSFEFGYNLQELVCKIFQYQKTSGKTAPSGQFHRYIDRNETSFCTENEFRTQTIYRLCLGMMCHLYHSEQPTSFEKSRKIKNRVMKLFTCHAKDVKDLVGGNSLILWTLFNIFPDWMRTFRCPPDKNSKNMQTIIKKYELEGYSKEQIDSIFGSLITGRSKHVGWQIDYTCAEHGMCKLARILRATADNRMYKDEQYYTNILKEQYFYDAYDPDQMVHNSTRNDIVVKDSDGKIIRELGRPVLINYWCISGQTGISMDYFVEYPEFSDALPDRTMNNNKILRFVSRFLNPLSTSFDQIRNSVENAYPNIDGVPMSPIHQDTWDEATPFLLTKIGEQNIY